MESMYMYVHMQTYSKNMCPQYVKSCSVHVHTYPMCMEIPIRGGKELVSLSCLAEQVRPAQHPQRRGRSHYRSPETPRNAPDVLQIKPWFSAMLWGTATGALQSSIGSSSCPTQVALAAGLQGLPKGVPSASCQPMSALPLLGPMQHLYFRAEERERPEKRIRGRSGVGRSRVAIRSLRLLSLGPCVHSYLEMPFPAPAHSSWTSLASPS